MTFGGPAHDRRIKPCGFDQDVLGLLRDHGVEPAHDSRESDGPVGVGDDQVLRIKFAIYPVESFERFSRTGATDDDLSTFEQIEIESMCGMSHFPERVVGSVGGIVDSALIHAGEAFNDCIWRRLNAHAANNARGVASATFFVFNGDNKVSL